MIQVKTLIGLLFLAFTLMVIPTGVTQAKKPLKSEIHTYFPCISGILIGDIEGNFTADIFYLHETRPGGNPAKYKTFAFWRIFTTDGNISMKQEGFYNKKTGKAKSIGVILYASGDLTYLIGSKVRIRCEKTSHTDILIIKPRQIARTNS